MLLNYTTDETIPIDVRDFIKEKEKQRQVYIPLSFWFPNEPHDELQMVALLNYKFVVNFKEN